MHFYDTDLSWLIKVDFWRRLRHTVWWVAWTPKLLPLVPTSHLIFLYWAQVTALGKRELHRFFFGCRWPENGLLSSGTENSELSLIIEWFDTFVDRVRGILFEDLYRIISNQDGFDRYRWLFFLDAEALSVAHCWWRFPLLTVVVCRGHFPRCLSFRKIVLSLCLAVFFYFSLQFSKIRMNRLVSDASKTLYELNECHVNVARRADFIDLGLEGQIEKRTNLPCTEVVVTDARHCH